MTYKENISYISKSERETFEFAKNLALQQASLNQTVFLLIGNYGSGKTLFVKGFASFYRIPSDIVTSPSFSLIQTYNNQENYSIFHMDCYRLEHESEIFDLGIVEMLEEVKHSKFHFFIEWADLFKESFYKLLINFKIGEINIKILSYTSREFTVSYNKNV